MQITDQNKDQVLVTKEGLIQLKDELEQLKTTKRKEVARKLKEAISYGDLSENSEYEEAKNEQAFIEGRIIELEKKIRNAKLISEPKRGKVSKTIKIGTTVTIKNLTDDTEEETYTIVGSTEADPVNHKISNESPIGMALIGQEKGNTISIKAPAGTFEYKIIALK